MDKVLLYFSLKYKGQWSKIYDALERKEKISIADLEAVEDEIDCKYLTILNPLYPETLKNSHKPPFVIFYKGDISLFTNYRKIITFVIDKQMNEDTEIQFKKLKKSFVNENKTFLKNGIRKDNDYDNLNGNRTISLINGMENIGDCYGLNISETYKENETENDFYQRLIFSLPIAVVVMNINRNGINMELMNSSISNNKDIFVIPQCNKNRQFANNYLIKQGAKLIEYPSDVLCEI